MAVGDWIILGDADDLFEKDMIETIVCTANNANADMCICYLQYFDKFPCRDGLILNRMQKIHCNSYPIVDTEKEAVHIMQVIEEKRPCTKLVHKLIYRKMYIFRIFQMRMMCIM